MTTRVSKSASSLIMGLCDRSHQKQVTQEWCDAILPLGLAIWYMDDGSCHFPTNQRPRARLATNGFSSFEVDLLAAMLKNRFGIECDSRDYSGHTLILTADGTEKLFCIVAPYIADSMKYKIAKRYASLRAVVPTIPETYAGIVETDVLDVTKSLPDRFAAQQQNQYDLTVAGNSNYFSRRILVHNTNIRVMFSGYNEADAAYGISFGGKTDNALIPATLTQRLQERFMTIEQRQKIAEIFPDGGCLYGEGYGAKIQKGGGNYRSDQDFVLFDVKVGEFWLERHNVEDMAQKLGLNVVPIIGIGTLPEMIQKAKMGFKSQWGTFDAEGIVARPACELVTRNGQRIITKIKHRDFT